MAIRIRAKQENLRLRSGAIIGPGVVVSVATDEAWKLYIRGLVEIVLEGNARRVEAAVRMPSEYRGSKLNGVE